jgi:hypothetical protein
MAEAVPLASDPGLGLSLGLTAVPEAVDPRLSTRGYLID